ncbi:MAG TPA: FAD/NAD(P)-binding protein, partial [Spirochaetia bacterium]|nr:FAD/NAD(P)-binding protein [Spirochaetia bacterium]
GEAPFGIASSPSEGAELLFSVKRVGLFTTELHSLEPGAAIGVRGPMGKPFPWDEMVGKNLLIIGGGFAFTTLRALVAHVLHPEHRRKFGSVLVLYGARSPGELMYARELAAWQGRDDIEVHLTVDKADNGWGQHVGVVPKVLENIAPSPKNSLSIVCGPPVMLRFTLPALTALGFPDESVILSLEMRMKCGIGKCGRCNIGGAYVCRDGPIFTRKDLNALPAEL